MRLLSCIVLAFCASCSWAFELEQLAQQLTQQQPVKGDFVQHKYLRALPMPLTSRGHYQLSAEHGLLWQVRQPVQQDYRIDAQGIALLTEHGWQAQTQQDANARQNRLFLAVLRGDYQALQEDFDLHLTGTADAWQLQLQPDNLLLKQVFQQIVITGATQVEQVELFEVQGDRTLMQFHSSDLSDHAGQP